MMYVFVKIAMSPYLITRPEVCVQFSDDCDDVGGFLFRLLI